MPGGAFLCHPRELRVSPIRRMTGTRKDGWARVVLSALCVFVTALVLSSAARAQSAALGEGAPADPPPTEAAPATAASPATSAEPRPAEFPGMLQGGVVAPPPQPALPPAWSTQRNLALIATAGSYSGFGLGFRAGWPRVGLDASFGAFPVLATFSANPEKFPKFKVLLGYEASASIYVGFYRPDARTDLGITFGYKYSSVLQHGVALAFYYQRQIAAHWAIQAFVGPVIFPDAESQIRKVTGWTGGSVSSGMAWHQGGAGLSVAFFP